MNQISTTYGENKISKLMLMLTLLIGFFTFSGFSGNLESIIDQRKTKTEVLIRTPRKVVSRIISYRHAISLLKPNHAECFHLIWKIALFSFNNLTQAKFTQMSLLPSLQHPMYYLYLTRRVPQKSDREEPSIS